MPRAAPRPCTHPGCSALAQSGSRCPAHPYERPQAEDSRPNSAARGYGSRWRRLRKMVLARDPICTACKRAPSTDADHIVPKSRGGQNTFENLQGLCHSCHSSKTATHDGGGYRSAALIPNMQHKPRIPVTVVCGAPCSGKSTYVDQRRAASDLVIDLDRIIADQTGHDLHATPPSGRMRVLRDALRTRNDLLYSLSRDRTHTRAWLVVSAPTYTARSQWHAMLDADVVLIHSDPRTCHSRADARPYPAETHRAIDRWFSRYSAWYQDTVHGG